MPKQFTKLRISNVVFMDLGLNIFKIHCIFSKAQAQLEKCQVIDTDGGFRLKSQVLQLRVCGVVATPAI